MPFPAQQVKRLRALLDDIDSLAQREESQFALRREVVSNWSVAEQLDHAVRICASILGRIHEPGETVPQKLNLVGRVILLVGWIPRGKGKSPKAFLPVPCSREEMRKSVSDARTLLDGLLAGRASESNDRIVPHPIFGGLTAREAFGFAITHTRHHMKIVREILAAQS